MLAHEHFLAVTIGNVWVDNIFIRFASQAPGSLGTEGTDTLPVPTLFHVHGGNMWVTNLTVQGDGKSECRAIIAFPGSNVAFIGALRSNNIPS
jgi:hypothetical protein